ncbi:MAG: D-alanine--D-alanine ligase [Microcoleaceae cyanobacterium]
MTQLISSPAVSSGQQTETLRVLHLAGSRVSEFYYDLSLMYVREVVQPAGVQSHYVIVHPDGCWQLGASLDSLSEKLSLQQMIGQLPAIDVVVPHMFCFPGMTSFRAFFEDMLGIPVVGSPAHCTALATDKAQTRSVVQTVGVPVAQAQQLRPGESPSLEPPFIVKPNAEDNSRGVTLVREPSEISAALQIGFELDNTLLVEDYIPGREIRVGVLERAGELQVLPMAEYLFPGDNPIRTVSDKLELRADGTPIQQCRETKGKTACPAQVTPELSEKLSTAAKQAHIALGCRDFSLYDFRVHAETGEPYLLEAGLFWCFGRISIISHMLTADGQNLEEVSLELWRKAANRTRIACGSLFKHAVGAE